MRKPAAWIVRGLILWPFLSGLAYPLRLLAFRRLGRQRLYHQPECARNSLTQTGTSRLMGIGEERSDIDALALGVIQLHRSPAQAGDEVATFRQNRLEVPHPRVSRDR